MITEREKSAGRTTNHESKLPNGKPMTREDIMRMAIEAGARDCANPDKWDIWEIRDTDLERFANLVAAHEREECAKWADLVAREIDNTNNTATYIASSIRARGEQ
jgi:hypothetical protein